MTSGRNDFTAFVRSLRDRDEGPDHETIDRTLEALRRALCSELKRLGLWECPPSFLGVLGHERWLLSSDDEAIADDALDDLVADCYVYVFLTRSQSLCAQLERKPSIDGLVFTSIRHFLYERQKASDPIGFRVFEMVRLTVRQAVNDGWLFVLSGDPRVRNETILSFSPHSEEDLAEARRVAEEVTGWLDELGLGLVTARRAEREAVLETLYRLLARLESLGLDPVCFQHLIEPLKREAKSRWIAVFDQWQGDLAVESCGGLTSLVRIARPAHDLEAADYFRKLGVAMRERIDQYEGGGRTKEYLWRLWQFVTDLAQHEVERVSQRKIAAQLGIPRDRLPGLFETLGELIDDCCAMLAEGPVRLESEEGALW